MSAVKYFVWSSNRWCEVDAGSGRVSGWRERARFVYVKRGKLHLARCGAVLQGLRALAAGAPLAVNTGPRLSQKRYSKVKTHNGRDAACRRCCCQLPRHSTPSPSRRPTSAHHTLARTSPRAQDTGHIHNRTPVKVNKARSSSPDASPRAKKLKLNRPIQVPTTDLHYSSDDSVQIRNGKALTSDSDYKTKNGKRQTAADEESHETDSDTPLKQSTNLDASWDDAMSVFIRRKPTSHRAGEMCKELMVEESDIQALRNWLYHNASSKTLMRYDQDDMFKRRLFYSINPLVTLERCPRIAKLLTASDASQNRFLTCLGLRSVSQDSEPVRRTRRSMRSKQRILSSDNESVPTNVRDKHVDNTNDTQPKADKSGKEKIKGRIEEDKETRKSENNHKRERRRERATRRSKYARKYKENRVRQSNGRFLGTDDVKTLSKQTERDSNIDISSDDEINKKPSTGGDEKRLARHAKKQIAEGYGRVLNTENKRHSILSSDKHNIINQNLATRRIRAKETGDSDGPSDRSLRPRNSTFDKDSNMADDEIYSSMKDMERGKLREVTGEGDNLKRKTRVSDKSSNEVKSLKNQSLLTTKHAETTGNDRVSSIDRNKQKDDMKVKTVRGKARMKNYNLSLSNKQKDRDTNIYMSSDDSENNDTESKTVNSKIVKRKSTLSDKQNDVEKDNNRNQTEIDNTSDDADSNKRETEYQNRTRVKTNHSHKGEKVSLKLKTTDNSISSDVNKRQDHVTSTREKETNKPSPQKQKRREDSKVQKGRDSNSSQREERAKETSPFKLRHGARDKHGKYAKIKTNKPGSFKVNNSVVKIERESDNSDVQSKRVGSGKNSNAGQRGVGVGALNMNSDSDSEFLVPAAETMKGQHNPAVSKRPCARGAREYSSLEDLSIVSWLSAGQRASRVNGNKLWTDLQDHYPRLTGIERTWQSLRNRYLRYILPSLGALALRPHTAARLRAAATRSGARPPRRPSIVPPAPRGAASRVPRPPRSPPHSPPRSPPPPPSSPPPQTSHSPSPSPPHKEGTNKRIHNDGAPRAPRIEPRYSDVTRRFAAAHALRRERSSEVRRSPRSLESSSRLSPTGAQGPPAGPPQTKGPHKTRKLYNPA